METNRQLAHHEAQVAEFPVLTKSPATHARAESQLHELPLTAFDIQDIEPPVIVKPKKKKSKSKKTKKQTDQKAGLGTARGLETMFRSSYRTQLDLTALAATKANIMISLNGFILSVLTLSGPFVLVAEPLFTIPIAVFLATCLVSIIFAVLAARPRPRKSHPTQADFKKDRANLLVFEDFSHLSEKEHLKAMTELMHDNTRIYKNMTRQIYMLGNMANRKFRMLNVSYTAFLAGLTISTLLLLVIGFSHNTPDLANLLSQVQIGPMH